LAPYSLSPLLAFLLGSVRLLYSIAERKLVENWVLDLVQNQTNSANLLCPTLVSNDIEKKQAMNSKGPNE
jgi:hypothetical protein